MSSFLEVYAKKHDGTGRTVAVFRDDAQGRRDADREARSWMARQSVASVSVKGTARIAQGRSVI